MDPVRRHFQEKQKHNKLSERKGIIFQNDQDVHQIENDF